MIYNLEKTLDNIEKNGIQEGIALVARNMLIKGFNIDYIVGLSKDEIFF